MARKQSTGQRAPMSPEARQRIAEAVRLAAERKRQDMGLPPVQPTAQRPQVNPSFVDRAIELVKMQDQHFSEDLFVPMPTGKAIDTLFTNDGGLPKACNYMVIGDPGVGKSTVTLDMLSDLAREGKKVLFISAEMTRIDLWGYVKRYPKFGEVPVLFLGEYLDANPKQVVEDSLKPGYDVVLIDSFAEVQEAVKESNYMTTGQSEKWLIDLMIVNNMGQNDTGTNTTFLAIQQVTKGGVFVGSNKLKHNTTGMMELRMDPDTGSSFVIFTKNRRGTVNRRLFFSLAESGDVVYDTRRLNSDNEAREALSAEKKQMEEEENAFDELFDTGGVERLTPRDF
jgi:predicted ATP-dependent serine protease